MFPDINMKTGTPSGGDDSPFTFVPPDGSDYGSRPSSRPISAASASGSETGMTFEDWQKRAGIAGGGSEDESRPGTAESGGDDEFSRTDGYTDYYNNEMAASKSAPSLGLEDATAKFGGGGGGGGGRAPKKSLKEMAKKTKKSMHDVAKQAKGVARTQQSLGEKKAEISKRSKAKERVMKQRQDHEAWVEQLAAACDSTNTERERLAAEIIFMEHNLDRKRLLSVILRLSRFKIHSAFQTWTANTIKPERDRKFKLRDEMRAELGMLAVQIKEDTASNELRREQILKARLSSTTDEQYALLLKIFGKLAGDKARAYFAHWLGMYRGFMLQYNLVKKILGKLVNQTLMKGWVKWYYVVFVASKMSLDDTIKALNIELAKARKRAAIAEKNVEDIANDAMTKMLASASKGQRALLMKILTKFCTLYIRYGMTIWRYKVQLYKTAKQKMGMIVGRLLNSELNYGMRRWIMVAMKDKGTAQELMITRYKREIDGYRELDLRVASRVEALCVKVEQMRESIQLQAIAADRVAQGIPDLADEFANISYVDRAASENPSNLVRLLPPGARGDGGGGPGSQSLDQGEMLQTTVFYGANKMVPASSVSMASASIGKTAPASYGRGLQLQGGGDTASLASSLESPSLNFAGIGFGTPMAPEERASLLVFVKGLEANSRDPKLARVAPHLEKHKKVIKRLALVGDPRLSACIKAYERTKDVDDLLESVEMIAAGMDFNVTPMY